MCRCYILRILLLGFTPSAIGLGLTIVPRMAVNYLWGYYSPRCYLCYYCLSNMSKTAFPQRGW
nr:MAG TPA: hypothetical protein [Caudoviricetes sp.]